MFEAGEHECFQFLRKREVCGMALYSNGMITYSSEPSSFSFGPVTDNERKRERGSVECLDVYIRAG